jgi:cation diffusion facilitator family transporter
MRAASIGIAANLLLAVAKCSIGLIGHSFALVADGVESLFDVGSGIVVWLGLRMADKPPDQNHPYGHGKAEPLATLIVGLFLTAAATLIAFESIHQIRTPHESPRPYVLIVIAIVIVLKSFLGRHVRRVGQQTGSTAVKADAWHHLTDLLISVFAFIGVSVALIGGRGWESADDWAALFAVPFILYNAIMQTMPAVLELDDIAPDPEIETAVRKLASSVPGVLGTDKCYVRKMGFRYYVDLHLVVRGEWTVRRGHALSHDVESLIRSEIPAVAEVLIHIEPEEELLRLAPSSDDAKRGEADAR